MIMYSITRKYTIASNLRSLAEKLRNPPHFLVAGKSLTKQMSETLYNFLKTPPSLIK